MAQLAVDSPETFSAICPFLHSREDPATAYAYPSVENRCYAPRGPRKLAADYQAAFCLGSEHEHCPYFLAQETRQARTNWPGRAALAPQPASAALENEAGPVDLSGAAAREAPPNWGSHLVGVSRVFRLAAQAQLLGVRRGLGSAQRSISGRAFPSVLVLILAIIVLFGGAAYLIAASSKPVPTNKVLSAGSISTPSADLTATEFPSETPETIAGLGSEARAPVTPTDEPTETALATYTEPAIATLPASPTEVASPTPLPTATDTPLPSSTPTGAKLQAPVSTPTFTPVPLANLSSEQTYPAPVLLEPLDGAGLHKMATFRWTSTHQLNSDEVFDIMVWHESMPSPAGIGTTTEQQVLIDFRIWIYQQYSGRFFWTIRIRRIDGPYLSLGSTPFSFWVNEGGQPPAAPPPASQPPPPPPKPTRPPPSPPPP